MGREGCWDVGSQFRSWSENPLLPKPEPVNFSRGHAHGVWLLENAECHMAGISRVASSGNTGLLGFQEACEQASHSGQFIQEDSICLQKEVLRFPLLKHSIV